MLRPDYDKFMKLFNEKNTRYKFHCIENDPNFYTPFGKVLDTETLLYEPDERGFKLAINIDIFIFDNAPDDDNIVKEMYDRRDSLRKHGARRMYPIFMNKPNGNILRRFLVYLLRAVYRVFPKYYFVQKIIENSKRFVNQDTKRVGSFTGYYNMVCDKRVFNDFIDVEFEGRKYKAPVGYDEWLRAMYGDYMQLPPVEKRVSTHTFVAYKK